MNELCAFLAQARKELQRYIRFDGTLKEPTLNDQGDIEGKAPLFEPLIQRDLNTTHIDWQQELWKTATIVDTTLFRAYMITRPGLAGSLFRLDNFCDPDVVKEKLYETGRFMELIDFLHGKKRHQEALELLEKFGKGERENDMEVEDALRGPRRIVAYLQQLPFEMIDLILNYAKWPMQQEPELGMQVFLADTENAETLPRDRITEFLTGTDERLAITYLEHVTADLGDKTTDFHDRLIKLYVKNLRNSKGMSEVPDHLQSKLETILRNSNQYTKKNMLLLLPKNGKCSRCNLFLLESLLIQRPRHNISWISCHNLQQTFAASASPGDIRVRSQITGNGRGLLQCHFPLVRRQTRPEPQCLHNSTLPLCPTATASPFASAKPRSGAITSLTSRLPSSSALNHFLPAFDLAPGEAGGILFRKDALGGE